MEKLIELLYKYQNIECSYPLYYDVEENKICLDSDARIWAEQYLISKQFWFIKWLEENEKIERNEKFYLEDDEWLFGTYECLLMQLAIQDEPIEFLISILKSKSDERVNGAINTLREVPEN